MDKVLNQHIFSLYRSYLRQVRALPHIYLRHFFAIKAADDFRSVLKTKTIRLCRSKLKRVSKDLRRLRGANEGQSVAFDRMLDIAYGRVGRLRWELMEPLLSDTNTFPVDPMTEKLRLPVYSPELVALLTSGVSHMTRPLQKHQLVSPPGLLERTLGRNNREPLRSPSRCQEYNIRWRFFKNESRKVYPPLGVLRRRHPNHVNTYTPLNNTLDFGCWNAILPELLASAELPCRSPGLPRMQREQMQKVFDVNPLHGGLSARLLRRRYQVLLGRVPLLSPRTPSQDNYECTYDVQLASSAITPPRPHPSRLRFIDAKDVTWINDIAQYDRRRK